MRFELYRYDFAEAGNGHLPPAGWQQERTRQGRAGGAGKRSLGLQKPLIVKTDKLILTDDNMIVQQDIHQFAGFFDSFGEIDV